MRPGCPALRRPRFFPLLPYLVLLPVGFAEPDRSPGLLVSSYLTVSPLPRRGGRSPAAVAVCFLWHFPYPMRERNGRWALPTTAPFGVRTFLRGTSPRPVRARRRNPRRARAALGRHGDHRTRREPSSPMIGGFPPFPKTNPTRKGSNGNVEMPARAPTSSTSLYLPMWATSLPSTRKPALMRRVDFDRLQSSPALAFEMKLRSIDNLVPFASTGPAPIPGGVVGC